jgi:poly-beta-1,6-N-acetyl-D-glucosamine synthase
MLVLTAVLYPITFVIFFLAIDSEYQMVSWADDVRLILFILFTPILVKYAVQLALAPWYGRRVRAAGSDCDHAPCMSVLIPAWNEEVGIVATIRSVVATDYPNLEIIVVNDGSTDATHEVVQAFIAEHEAGSGGPRPPIRYLSQANGGKARALNAGLALATGEIVVTIDADSVMDPDFLDRIARYFDRHDVAAVAGNVVIGNRSRPIALVQQLEYLYGFYFKRAEAIMGAVYIVGGAAAAYRRGIIGDLGGFDESVVTEDIELSTRLQRLGHRVGYAADAVVYTEGPSDLLGLCRQRLRWKHGRLLTFYKHRQLFGSRDRSHSRFLTLLIMPVALYAELLLLLEPALMSIFLGYTLLTSDFVPLAAFISMLTLVVWFQVWSDRRRGGHWNLLALAPVAWLLFYWLDTVEYQALVRSISRLATRRRVAWQRWQRQGVFSTPEPNVPLR